MESDVLNQGKTSLYNLTFKLIVLINTLFFAGYFILKCPLAYVLQSNGFELREAYSITTTANILFGIFLLFWFKQRTMKPYHNLLGGLFLLTLSFIVLVIGIAQENISHQLGFIYPFFSMILFACAEFLLQTTMNSRVKDLLIKQGTSEIFATGLMRSSRAFGAVIGYYLMSFTLNKTAHILTDTRSALKLYSIAAVICMSLFFLSLGYLNRQKNSLVIV